MTDQAVFVRSLKQAGWRAGRRVAVPADVPRGHPAWDILSEYCGLSLAGRNGSAVINYIPDVDELPARWGEALATHMIGIGEIEGGHGEFYVSAAGRLFGNSIVHPAFFWIGPTFIDGMRSFIAGVRSRPMLLPDQQEIWLYGDHFRHGDPEVLGPASAGVR